MRAWPGSQISKRSSSGCQRLKSSDPLDFVCVHDIRIEKHIEAQRRDPIAQSPLRRKDRQFQIVLSLSNFDLAIMVLFIVEIAPP
ncbi:hypothetical protein HGP17_32270 [Rhizobium sp. P38BS-XIX]|uniref:hypothetical protein n=1 Tax=Rhizobium sp. P38BS-XIX TaxID=2726740 RepID=UPI00145644BC|nr:hypothetical protein [Rhizobium sp. P38BS-XIX]NLS01534.1 hypothetical protein [Rhizobium sp. P38BS-XIX]